ncbi:MAG: hypothetical protein WAM14_09630 [Candidatus Nitrosopolaris sp.]
MDAERPTYRPSVFTTNTPVTVTSPTATTTSKQNTFEDIKSKQIPQLHDSRVETEKEHIKAFRELRGSCLISFNRL